MDGTGEHYLKWLWAGSKGQKTHVIFFSFTKLENRRAEQLLHTCVWGGEGWYHWEAGGGG
jgi:hypothetical protein